MKTPYDTFVDTMTDELIAMPDHEVLDVSPGADRFANLMRHHCTHDGVFCQQDWDRMRAAQALIGTLFEKPK